MVKKTLYLFCFGLIGYFIICLSATAFAENLDENIYFSRGINYENSGQYDLAIEEYTKAIKINPKIVNAYIRCGYLYSHKHQFDLAMINYNKALEINPNDSRIYTVRGNLYMSDKKYNLAILDYSKAIKLNPKNKYAYFNRGTANYFIGKYELAIYDYSKTIDIDPKNYQAYYGRGKLYFNSKKYDLAVSDYTKVIKINPKFIIAYYSRGLALSHLKQNQKAIDDFYQYIRSEKPNKKIADEATERVLELQSSKLHKLSIDEVYWLGTRKEDKGDYNKAIEYYSEVINRNKNYKNIYAIRGLAYVFVKKYDLALADYLKAIDINPNEYGFYHSLGNIYAVKQKFDLAIKEYTKVIDNEDSYFTRLARGKTYFKIQKYDLALNDFKQMDKIWSGKDESVYCIASLYGFLGQYEKCMDTLQKGLNKFGDYPIFLFLMGQCYEQQGQKDEATKYYKKAFENRAIANDGIRLTVPIMAKLEARLTGDWNNYKEWLVSF